MQDAIHEAAKLRTRLLKREKPLVLGNKIASATFLDSLLKVVGKDIHLLKEDDLNLTDKMNDSAAERLSRMHVRQLLQELIPGIVAI